MVVRQAVSEVVDIASQDGVGQGVAFCADFPAAEQEFLGVLGGGDGVEHDRDIAGRRVFHTDGNTDAAGDHAVELVFDGAGSDGGVGQEIRQVAVDFRVEDFFRAGESRFADDAGVHFADGDNAGQHVFLAFRVGLMEHALVAYADGTRLVGIDAGNDEDSVGDFFLHGGQAMGIVDDGVFVVGRAGPDDEQEAVVFTGQDAADRLVALRFDAADAVVDGELFHKLLRRRQFSDEFNLHCHNTIPSCKQFRPGRPFGG